MLVLILLLMLSKFPTLYACPDPALHMPTSGTMARTYSVKICWDELCTTFKWKTQQHKQGWCDMTNGNQTAASQKFRGSTETAFSHTCLRPVTVIFYQHSRTMLAQFAFVSWEDTDTMSEWVRIVVCSLKWTPIFFYKGMGRLSNSKEKKQQTKETWNQNI